MADTQVRKTWGCGETQTGGRLGAWKARRDALLGQAAALSVELVQAEALFHRDLRGEIGNPPVDRSIRASLSGDGTLTLGAVDVPDPHGLRDFLCEALGTPGGAAASMTREQAVVFAARLVGPRAREGRVVLSVAIASVVDALDHVGALRSDTPTPPHEKAPGTPASQQGARPATAVSESHAGTGATGTAGSAQNPNAASEDWESLHGVDECGGGTGHAPTTRDARAIVDQVCLDLLDGTSSSLTTHRLPTTRFRSGHTTWIGADRGGNRPPTPGSRSGPLP